MAECLSSAHGPLLGSLWHALCSAGSEGAALAALQLLRAACAAHPPLCTRLAAADFVEARHLQRSEDSPLCGSSGTMLVFILGIVHLINPYTH